MNIVAMAHWCGPPEGLEGEIWSINNSHYIWGEWGRPYKPTRIIAMDDLRRDEKTHPKYVKQILDAGVPVLSTFDGSGIYSNVEPYPLEKVFKVFRGRNLFDNSINYALMLALVEGHKEISLWGCDFVQPYDKTLLDGAKVRWLKRGHENTPDWFKYYDEMNIHWRAPGEPGQESLHYLLGWAKASGVRVATPEGSTILNADRDGYFYGYQEQPDGM